MGPTSSSKSDSGTPGICCHVCEKNDAEIKLMKCPICFKHFCDEHAYLWSGRPFCSNGCAEYFYFGDEDSEG
jgi:hypothetical protein